MGIKDKVKSKVSQTRSKIGELREKREKYLDRKADKKAQKEAKKAVKLERQATRAMKVQVQVSRQVDALRTIRGEGRRGKKEVLHQGSSELLKQRKSLKGESLSRRLAKKGVGSLVKRQQKVKVRETGRSPMKRKRGKRR